MKLRIPALLCAAALVSSASFVHSAEAKRPNVIFILTDNQGWGDAHFAGHPYVQTPNLDGLASQSTWFKQFYVAATVCLPNRCAFMTSHLPALYMCVSPFANVPRERLSEYRAMRTSRYTYVRGLQGPRTLYDDQKDRFQTNNLVWHTECASLVRELDQRLAAQLKRIGDDFRPGKEYLAEWGYEVATHGSVPYAAGITKVQIPRLNLALQAPKSAAEKSPTTNAVPQNHP